MYCVRAYQTPKLVKVAGIPESFYVIEVHISSSKVYSRYCLEPSLVLFSHTFLSDILSFGTYCTFFWYILSFGDVLSFGTYFLFIYTFILVILSFETYFLLEHTLFLDKHSL